MGMRNAAVMAGMALTLMSGTAKAVPILYDYTFTSTNDFGIAIGDFSGTLSVDQGLVKSITGSGSKIGTITSLYAPGTIKVIPGYPANDNLFSLSGFNFTRNGLTFATTNFAAVNLYYENGYVAVDGFANGSNGTFTVSAVSPVPLPAAAPLYGAALIALGAVGYGMRRKQAAAAA